MIHSVFSKLMIDLMNQVDSALEDVRMVDRYLGQDQTNIRPAILCPAVLIDIESEQYQDMGGGSQYVEPATITVRLCVDNYSASGPKAPQNAREQSMKDFELEKALVDCIHGWVPGDNYCTSLVRTEASSENRNDIGLRIRTITFTTSFEDIDL